MDKLIAFYMARSILVFYLSFISLGFIGCGTGTVSEKSKDSGKKTDTIKYSINLSDIKIGYVTPSLNAPFYVVLSQYIEEYSERYGMNFVMADGQDDIIQQITSMEDLITTGVDVLILNPLDHKALVPAVNSAAESDIPVFIVDSRIDPDAKYITSVQASNEGNGELIGEWVVNQMSGKDIKAAMISGSQGNPVGREKRLGFVRGFVETQLITQGNADLKIVFQGWGNWTHIGGLEAMEDILVSHPNVNLLVAENDAMGMGALKAINESGKSEDIMVVGFDGQKEALELIKKGEYGATALNSPEELARLVVEAVVKHLDGEQVDKVIHTPPVLITKDNVDEYYDPDALF